MTDPWADVRERLKTRNHLGDTLSKRLGMMIDMPPNWENAMPRIADEVRELERAMDDARENVLTDADALLAVVRAAKTYRDSHTMEGANKEGELLMDFTARIVDERAKIDEALAALPEHLK